MVKVFNSISSDLGSMPNWGHHFMFLNKQFNFLVFLSTCICINGFSVWQILIPGGNPTMDKHPIQLSCLTLQKLEISPALMGHLTHT